MQEKVCRAEIAYASPPMKLAQGNNGQRGVMLDLSLGESGMDVTRRRREARKVIQRAKRRKLAGPARYDVGDLKGLSDDLDWFGPSIAAANRSAL